MNKLYFGLIAFVLIAGIFAFGDIGSSDSVSSVSAVEAFSLKGTESCAIMTQNFLDEMVKCKEPATACGTPTTPTGTRQCTNTAGGGECACACTMGGPGNTPEWNCAKCDNGCAGGRCLNRAVPIALSFP